MGKEKDKENGKRKGRNITHKRPRRGGSKDEPSSENYRFDMRDNNERRSTSHDLSPVFADDDSYNRNLFLRESHNCYTYFLNLKSKEALKLCKDDFKHHNMCRRAQPGYLSGFQRLTKKDYKCPEIHKRTLADNSLIYKLKNGDEKCDRRFYKGAMVVAPGRDYHYYRQNDSGRWTHKPGYKPSTKYDSNRNLVLDPQWAARDYGGTLNYKDFCGYYCVPRNDKRKQMSHSTRGPIQRRNLEYEAQEQILKKLKVQKTNNTRKILDKRVANIVMETQGPGSTKKRKKKMKKMVTQAMTRKKP